MDLRVLEYFVLVAREENITRAAQILHVSQPSVSRQLRQLEDELGVKLFERHNHSVMLTGEGVLFKRRAQELLALAQRAREELAPAEEELAGDISIGMGELLASSELAEIITAFRRQHPRVKFLLKSAINNEIKFWLEQGTLDFGLLLEPVEITRYEFLRLKTKEEWGVLVRADDPLAAKDAIRPGDLAGIPVITTHDEMTHNELASWSGKYAADMSAGMGYNLLYNAAMMVREGYGPAVCLNLKCSYEGVKFLPLRPKLAMSSVLAWKGQQPLTRTVSAFIGFAKDYLNTRLDGGDFNGKG
ncbi:MAG: LysR family transcriptional regulator [Selenomonas sp.]|nr:LysR family transcriptional regulator [Selenomonas sp.]